MQLELGDHVWYWNGRISLDRDIPQREWFGTTAPGAYGGHGTEIFHYVVHADEIARGRPHMRNYEGSYAWLNNNPGNITRPGGGVDWGQYAGKVCWHNFLIFPDWATGWWAIAKLLRSPTYVNLSILDAFKKYAPASDGNDPVAYANAVAAALAHEGVTTATRVGDLDENQMAIMQNKIQQVEGAIPGDSLSWDSEDIPVEISGMLPAMVRKPIRPSAVPRRAGAFDLDMSAPVDVDGFTGGLGGPGVGTHSNPTAPWYIAFGNDIGGAEGTPVYAAFDGHVTKFKPHDPAADTAKVYGAEIFMRSNNDLMGAFYTHLTDVSGSIRPGAYVSRGDYLGTIHRQGSTATHLHMALVEIIGGAPNGQYKGVNLYDFLDWLDSSDGSTVVPVRFWQDGRPPEPLWNGVALGVMPMPIEPFAPIAPLAPVTPPLDGAQTNGVHAYGDGRYAGVPSGPNAT